MSAAIAAVPPSLDDTVRAALASGKTVLLKFTGQWCPPCKVLKPTIQALAAERPDVTVITIDVDEEQALAERFAVRSLPTLIAFRGGRPLGQLIGLQNRARIDTLLAP